MKSYARVVFVDQSERRSLSSDISKQIDTAGNTFPLLVFLTPDNKTNLGSFNHVSLRNQNYKKIFRDLKKKIKAAKKEGALKSVGSVESSDDEDSDDTDGADSDTVVISDPEFKNWKSAKGKIIRAKLLKFDGETYYLKSPRGRDFKVTADDLDADTVKMADEIVSANKK